MSLPSVSCLCSSQPARWGHLQRAILNFGRQTLTSAELIIVVAKPDYANVIREYVEHQSFSSRVRVLSRIIHYQLEGLQFALMSAFAPIIALWDDDNLDHPERLDFQYKHQVLRRDYVTALTKGFYFFHQDNELFVVDCFDPAARAVDQVLPTTLMAYRDYFPIMDQNSRMKPSEYMIRNTISSRQKLAPLGIPGLHVVGVTMSHECPHVRGYEKLRALAEQQAVPVAKITSEEFVPTLDAYTWPDVSISVEGKGAGAFTYTPKNTWGTDLYPIRTDGDTIIS